MDFNEYCYLCHHGIKGMKWGVRRYQDKNGRLTAAGRERYSSKRANKAAMSNRTLFSDNPPRYQDKNGNFVYPKGSKFGHAGTRGLRETFENGEPLWCYNNKADYDHYVERFAHGDHTNNFVFRLKKDLKAPSLTDWIDTVGEHYGYDLDYLYENLYEEWKNIEVKVGYYDLMRSMNSKGYDIVPDVFDYLKGVTDAVIVLDPINSLESIKTDPISVLEPIKTKR